MKKYYTIKEISEMFNVTVSGVRYWINKKGLKYKTEKIIGIKPRKVISPDDVKEILNLTNFNKSNFGDHFGNKKS